MLTIKFRTLAGNNYSLLRSPNDNIESLAIELAMKENVDKDNINIIFSGKILDKNKTIKEVGLSNNDFCVLFIKPQKLSKTSETPKNQQEENNDEEEENQGEGENNDEEGENEEGENNDEEEGEGNGEGMFGNMMRLFDSRNSQESSILQLLLGAMLASSEKGGEDREITQEQENDINKLVEMGFTRNRAIEAYFTCDENIERAAEYIISSI